MASFKLPAAAVDSLADPAIRLELHCISFSHYVERARWTLRLLGLPYDEVSYLPLLHMPGILLLQRRFRQGPGPSTASSKSPAATPCLALYSAAGTPLCLLQDSALICRYAVLRAAALKLPYAAPLYGLPALTLTPPPNTSTTNSSLHPAGLEAEGASGSAASGAAASGGGGGAGGGAKEAGRMLVAGGDGSVCELEARLGGTLGIETRRLAYHHLLPLPSVGGALFTNNSGSSSKLVARLTYYLCRLLLPKLLRINAATAAAGKQRLLAEFDYLDGLVLLQQQRGAQAPQAAAAGSTAQPRLPYYLLGPDMSIADIQLACLAAPILCIPNDLATTWLPPLDSLPQELRELVQSLRERPTGKFVMDMWRVHGPVAAAAADAAVPTSRM